MSFFSRTDKTKMVEAADALPGRDHAIVGNEIHTVLGTPIMGPYPDGFEKILVGMGCFWGAERKFWQAPGVWTTAVGYTAGFTPNPTYQETCTNLTGHAEVVLAVFDPNVTSYEALLQVFWENHDPTQGMRQGNDVGTTYRSGIYTYDDRQLALAQKSRDAFATQLAERGFGAITSEIIPAPELYFAEDYHQQYLDKNPNGYCGMGGTGVSCPIGLFSDDTAAAG